jgi:hypothetical protein
METPAGSESMAWMKRNCHGTREARHGLCENRVRKPKGLSTSERKLWRESDLLVVLGAWESHVHGEAAGQNEFSARKHKLHKQR